MYLIQLHALSPSFASVLVQKGVSLFVIKELLGHQDLVIDYSNLFSLPFPQQNLKDAVNIL
jgi:site-specific recombinase XerC